MFGRIVDKGVVLAVAAGGQAIGNALYDAGRLLYENRDGISAMIRSWF